MRFIRGSDSASEGRTDVATAGVNPAVGGYEPHDI